MLSPARVPFCLVVSRIRPPIAHPCLPFWIQKASVRIKSQPWSHCMARTNSIFRFHLSLNFLVNTQRLRSSSSKYFASRYGVWTSIGTTACSRYSCLSCSSAPLSGRRVCPTLLTVMNLTSLVALENFNRIPYDGCRSIPHSMLPGIEVDYHSV
jgi:hypothetical protein